MKRYSAPKAPFARKYTSADVALLVEMDRANEDVCGPAIVHLFRRALQEYGDQRYLRLATLSPSHLHNVRKSASYQAQRRSLTKPRPVCNPIGVRRVPRPNGRAGYVRIDTVHQGDLDGVKGVYHITCVDAVCQWQVEACVQGISEAFLLPVLELRVTAHAVQVLHRGLRVASHMHCAHKGGFTAVTEHLPDRHQHQAQWTPERLLAWGQRIGPACASTVQKMLERQLHAEHAYRPCLGLQSLCKRHGDARLEAACTLALSLGTCKYTHIRYILANRRDLLQASTTPQWTSPLHAHVRGPGYYQ